jgi:D-alanyl-D-alanine dipeptidase
VPADLRDVRKKILILAAFIPQFAALAVAQSPKDLLPGPKPPDVSLAWKQLVGIYDRGNSKDSFILLEQNQRLFWRDSRKVTDETPEMDGILWIDAGGGRRIGLTEQRDDSGTVRHLYYLNEVYTRVDANSDSAHSYRVTPSKPVNELRATALVATPPAESGAFRKPDLVELAPLDASIHLDIRYATSNDFLGTPVYSQARAFLQRPAAEALLRVQQKLKPLGYGLLIHDAYRPWYVTKIFWDATPPEGKIFVADPAQGSRHNRGCAVDLTLYDLATGKPVEMPGTYDEMSPRSFPDYPGGTSLQRWHRDLLRRAMESEGFTVYEAEWWHFDYKDWKEYGILNIPFEKFVSGPVSVSVH